MTRARHQMPTALLGGLSAARFLRDYWQKKPLLIRGAIPDFTNPFSPEELAGLACEEGVESRLVLERDGPTPWHLRHGPFTESDFTSLPASHWSLLVQGVNKYLPAAADLLDRFDFVPGWRIDDLMVSYAPPEGSVGPHIDQYDVFLLQGWGRRRWQIEDRAPKAPELVPDLPLRILRHFAPDREWVLEPGDMLYLPPGIPHHGVALEPGMTFSIGFRAPSAAELIGLFYDELAAGLADTERYTDPDPEPPAHAGAISPAALARVRAILRHQYLSDEAMDRWFGRFITEPKLTEGLEPREHPLSDAEFAARAEAGTALRRNEYGRFAYFERDADTLLLYVDGEELAVPAAAAAAARFVCDARRYPAEQIGTLLATPAARVLLTELYNRNALYFEDEDE